MGLDLTDKITPYADKELGLIGSTGTDAAALGSAAKVLGMGNLGSVGTALLGALASSQGFMDFLHTPGGRAVETGITALAGIEGLTDIAAKMGIWGAQGLQGFEHKIPGFAAILYVAAVAYESFKPQIDPILSKTGLTSDNLKKAGQTIESQLKAGFHTVNDGLAS